MNVFTKVQLKSFRVNLQEAKICSNFFDLILKYQSATLNYVNP